MRRRSPLLSLILLAELVAPGCDDGLATDAERPDDAGVLDSTTDTGGADAHPDAAHLDVADAQTAEASPADASTSEAGGDTMFADSADAEPDVSPDPLEPPERVELRNAHELLIDGARFHPYGEDLVAHVRLPPDASADAPVPACLLVHGSGGLFREGVAGDPCADRLEPSYEILVELLNEAGAAVVAPSSFYSRDPRFCEDNDPDFFGFAPPPFFAADTPPDDKTRDTVYDIRRTAVRTLDALAAMRYAAALAEGDATRLCMVGTSNGGSVMLAYAADHLERHLVEYLTPMARTYEDADDLAERVTALETLPPLPPDLEARLAERPTPTFVHAIAPGCRLRKIVPTVHPDEALAVEDLYYPEDGVDLVLEVGTMDNVVTGCATEVGKGIRELQARAVEASRALAVSRYTVHVHEAGHDLLRDGAAGDEIRRRLARLVSAWDTP